MAIDSDRFARALGERGPAVARKAATAPAVPQAMSAGLRHRGHRRMAAKTRKASPAATAATKAPWEPLAHNPKAPAATTRYPAAEATLDLESSAAPRTNGRARTRKPANVFALLNVLRVSRERTRPARSPGSTETSIARAHSRDAWSSPS